MIHSTPLFRFPQPPQGARAEVQLTDGTTICDEIHVANAHPVGTSPFVRRDYIAKFDQLVEGKLLDGERDRFLELVQRLPELSGSELGLLNVVAKPEILERDQEIPQGIF